MRKTSLSAAFLSSHSDKCSKGLIICPQHLVTVIHITATTTIQGKSCLAKL